MKAAISLLIPSLLGLAALSSAANADTENKLSQQGVPIAVREAFQKAYPQAADIKYEKDSKAGKAAYEIEFKDQGLEREATYADDGTLLETEEEIRPDALPTTITEALKKAHPQAMLEEAEKVMKPDGEVSGYEVEMKDGEKEWEVHLDTTGKILKTETE